ncbi:MAG: LCP family protein, partial [Myxococcota bacterium]
MAWALLGSAAMGLRRLFRSKRAWFLLSLLGAIGAGVGWLLQAPMTYEDFRAREQARARPFADAELPSEPMEEPGEPDEHAIDPLDADVPALDAGLAASDAASEDAAPALPVRTARVERSDDAPDFEEALAVLLVGVDRTRGRWGRADTIVVAVFDSNIGHAGLVSVPRDLYLPIPGHGHARINASLRIADRLSVDPVELLGELVGEVLQIPIDHVIIGNLRAFEGVVDALGGIEVDVPCAIVDDFLDERTESGRRVLDVQAGRQSMDGATAAMYARSRHGRSDWSRSRRQHAILTALRRRVADVGVTRWLPALSGALQAGVVTDMSRLELLGLLRRGRRLREGRLHGVLLGSRETEHHRTPEGRSVLLPNYDAIDEALEGVFRADAPGAPPHRRRCRPPRAALERRRERRARPAASPAPGRSPAAGPLPAGPLPAAGPSPAAEPS